MTAATFAVMVAIANWRQSGTRRRDNLKLQLALEQQRMLALRAQLEPHFMFNALNAISAMVRSGDSALALGGINRLSELLRYALAASVRDTVSVADELQFVCDYLDLQRLRYGERLRVSIEGGGPFLHEVDCPPLLLQPLVENALRHDLDCHDGPSDIRLRFERSGDYLQIRVSNSVNMLVNTPASPNPGAGLGLSNTRDRLQLMHPGASLRAGPADGRFVAEVRLPFSMAGD
jgi:LytS/YehU family sensor histidine kinase